MKYLNLDGKKDASLLFWSVKRPRKIAKVRIPLEEPGGFLASPTVALGETVRAGQRIAIPENGESVFIHSGVSGMVTGTEDFPHSRQGYRRFIEITCDETQDYLEAPKAEREYWGTLTPDEMITLFRECGLRDLSAGGASLHVKYSDHLDYQISTLILNGCDSEPYVSSRHALLMSHAVEVLRGAEILRRLVGADRVVVAVEDSSRELGEIMRSKIFFLRWEHFSIRVLPARYPQGKVLSLVRDVAGVDLLEGDEAVMKAKLSESMDQAVTDLARERGITVEDAATCFAVYEAVIMQKPFCERVVSVAGECVIDPANMVLPIGISFDEAFRTCRGLMREPYKVILGGPMSGAAQAVLDVPVTSCTDAVLALSLDACKPAEAQACIQCGKCIDVCPSQISPARITLAAEVDLFEVAEEWGAGLCTSCGNCGYICPSKRPMLELIRYVQGRIPKEFPSKTTPILVPEPMRV